MRGLGRLFKRGPIWWIAYYQRGKEYRESSLSENEGAAKKLLKKRLGEIMAGKFIGPREDRLTFEDMVKDLEKDYLVNSRRSLATARYHVKHLRSFFGLYRAIDIKPDKVKDYQAQRLEEKGAPATINREVACLGRMLSLAVSADKLSRKPKFKLLEGEKVRQGFMEHGDFVRLLTKLPDHLRPLIEFLYLSGWRKGEGQSLEWRDVDLEGRAVRLRIENSKTKESRFLPLTGRLLEIIEQRKAERRLDCPFVFHHNGIRIKEYRKTWKSACIAAGLGRIEIDAITKKKRYCGTIVHDLRRCAARNLSRAGVQEAIAMQFTGHKTNSMYRRYRIVSEDDMREAAETFQAHLSSYSKTPKVKQLKSAI